MDVYVETFSDKRHWVRAALSVGALWELIAIYIREIVYIQDRRSINNQHATHVQCCCMARWTRQEPEKTLAPLDDDITINLPNTFISAAIRLGWPGGIGLSLLHYVFQNRCHPNYIIKKRHGGVVRSIVLEISRTNEMHSVIYYRRSVAPKSIYCEYFKTHSSILILCKITQCPQG